MPVFSRRYRRARSNRIYLESPPRPRLEDNNLVFCGFNGSYPIVYREIISFIIRTFNNAGFDAAVISDNDSLHVSLFYPLERKPELDNPA